ncbi:MAG: hypothetical protein ACC661_10885, partial [Verrucomicrobiales bacterium]
MDLFVSWNRLIRSSARPSWLIEVWLSVLFDAREIELIESAIRDSEPWPSECRSMILHQFERLGFYLLLDDWRTEDRRSRIFAASKVVRSRAGKSRDEWPIELSESEKEQMSTLLDKNAWIGFR